MVLLIFPEFPVYDRGCIDPQLGVYILALCVFGPIGFFLKKDCEEVPSHVNYSVILDVRSLKF